MLETLNFSWGSGLHFLYLAAPSGQQGLQAGQLGLGKTCLPAELQLAQVAAGMGQPIATAVQGPVAKTERGAGGAVAVFHAIGLQQCLQTGKEHLQYPVQLEAGLQGQAQMTLDRFEIGYRLAAAPARSVALGKLHTRRVEIDGVSLKRHDGCTCGVSGTPPQAINMPLFFIV